MSRSLKIAAIAAALAVPAAAMASMAASGGADGGCFLSFCASLFSCGG